MLLVRKLSESLRQVNMATFVTLNNGNRIPQVALGTSRNSVEKIEVSIKLALEMGYRHIDTAFGYINEVAIGKALQEYIESTNLKREDVFITSKLHRNYLEGDAVGPALDESLRRLRLDYLDLFLIHNPCAMKNPGNYPEKFMPNTFDVFQPIDLRETWKAMEDTVYQKKTRCIGVSCFNSKQLDYICEGARIKPAINQVEVHARLPQKKLHDFCKSRNIQIEAFCPLGSPFFKGPMIMNRVQSSDNLVEHPIIINIAKTHKCTPGQVLLRNLLQRDIIVIPKSENPKRMKENLELFSFSLSDEDMEEIAELDNGVRRFDTSWTKEHPDYPYHADF